MDTKELKRVLVSTSTAVNLLEKENKIINVIQETKKPEYIAMSGQSDRFKKKWAREQARKVYRDSK